METRLAIANAVRWSAIEMLKSHNCNEQGQIKIEVESARDEDSWNEEKMKKKKTLYQIQFRWMCDFEAVFLSIERIIIILVGVDAVIVDILKYERRTSSFSYRTSFLGINKIIKQQSAT